MSEAPPSPGETLGQDETVAASHVAAEGAPAAETMGSASTVRNLLFATEPHRPLDAIESPWDPQRGGPKRLVRGLQKMADVDGIPAIVDVGLGTLETFVLVRERAEQKQSDDSTGQNDREPLDPDLAALVGEGGV
ncbi:hypothetical protein C453_04059 [Haloferax elongans ATCC BAA-1513]|uniref:Uncharacterized protein n=1 Tax=Haloferax elongans ATCC BAA-1513 TaxID=1230453 RepID=M0HSR3_HALEO|nr:hypothetical protein [Haloferax elongans]ELZ87496.1 hypothetical protein C453_04059 [Haloferax elongans ATCC BAA-1513]